MSKEITKIISTDFMETTLQALHTELEENKYVLPTASSTTLGGVKTTSKVTSNSGYTACPIISGVPYYKDTNTDTNNFVLQSASTTSNYRPLMLGYNNSTDKTTLEASVTNQIYATKYIYAQPSTGAIFANSFNGNLNGNATSATKATNATNADKASTATTLTGLTSSITELNYCKGVTSNIQTQLNNRIINNVFMHNGISGTNGYIAFARLKITSSYVNRPIEFELICRGKSTPCYVHVTFANTSTNDPNLSSLQYWGTDYGVFAIKEDVSTWLLYHHKSESYDNVTVAKVQAASQSITITYPEVFITEKPTENVINATLGGYIGNANVATTANNALKLNGFYLSTSGAKNTWSSIPSIGSDGVMEVGKFIDFHVTKESTTDYDVRITATTSGLTLSGTTSGTFSGNLSGNASSSTKLQTARTFQTNLASTSTASFDGTVNVTPGVKGILSISNGGTGQNSANSAANVFINSLATGGSIPQDNDYFISQYVNGGTTTTTYHRRPISTLWTYIKGKADSTYALSSHSHSYLPLSGGTMTGSLILNTATGDKPLRITRQGSTTEQTSIYQNDGGLVLDVTNDEKTSHIIINMNSTDTESSDGAGANNSIVKISSSSSGSNILATTFSGTLQGNSSTATKLFTARTISLTGAVTGSGTFDGSNNLSIATTTNHTHSYIPLSGSTAITGVLRTTKEFQTTSANGLRLVQGDYGMILRNDGGSTYLLFTNKGDQYGGWNTLRPFSVNNSTGVVTFGNGINGTLTGSLTGNASTATKLATARTISLTGSVTGSGSFDGSGNLSISTTTNHNHSFLDLKGTSTINSTSNDTTAKWGVHKNSVHWYATSGQLKDQPSQYGYLINVGQGSEVHQFWTVQPSGNVLHRGGNADNWSGTWRTFLDSSNYKNYCNLSNIGAAASSHSHNYAGSSSAGGAATSANSMNSSGFGNGNLTYFQTSGDFDGNTNWCHYIIANHGDGASYYHYTIGLPFWSVPIYQRQTGNTSSKTGWHTFYTSENITCGTWSLTPGSSSLASGSIYLQYE